MDIKITDYIEMDKLEAYKLELKTNEIKDIYKDNNIRISLWKRGEEFYLY